MTLFEKIKQLRNTLTDEDFAPTTGTIVLQNDSDGRGDYIREWNHPTVTRPTQQELDGVS
jgi:hypothetical protein